MDAWVERPSALSPSPCALTCATTQNRIHTAHTADIKNSFFIRTSAEISKHRARKAKETTSCSDPYWRKHAAALVAGRDEKQRSAPVWTKWRRDITHLR